MTILILAIIALFYFIFRIRKWLNKVEDQPSFYRRRPTYDGLKKLFFSVSAGYVNHIESLDQQAGYGLLMETQLFNNSKTLFGVYLTGFMGFYNSQRGGLIGGKYYDENDEIPWSELCSQVDLPFLDDKSFSTIRLLKYANKFLQMGDKIPRDSYGTGTEDEIQFWFLTQAGDYYHKIKIQSLVHSDFRFLIREVAKLLEVPLSDILPIKRAT